MRLGFLHWDYYLVLENDLLSCRRYVEFHSTNMQVYSIEFVRILLATCSEIDVVAKGLCKMVNPNANQGNIDGYRIILDASLSLSKFEVEDSQTQTWYKPFEEWGEGKSPTWWRAHNEVKHDRLHHYSEATLQNSIDALAGLFVLNLYHYHEAVEKAELDPASKFFKPMADTVPLTPRIVVGYRLPHVEKLRN